MKTTLLTLVKRLSSILIPAAVGLEGWAFYKTQTGHSLPGFVTPMLWLGGFALGAHLLEAGVAAVVAAQRQKDPLRWGAYTFLVGTVGLVELFEARGQGEADSVPRNSGEELLSSKN